MVSYPTTQSVIFNDFKGIRTRNGVASGGVLSATKCVNVEFAPSSYDASIAIQTALGNIRYCQAPNGYTIIKGFEFNTENDTNHLLFYCENDTEGKLFEYKNKEFVPIDYNSYTDDDDNEVEINISLEKTGQANGIILLNQAYNTFIFTNGKQYIAWCPDADNKENKESVLRIITPQVDNKSITGLALAEFDGSLVIGSNEGYVLASSKSDITNFDVTGGLDTSAWYETFGKPVTAIVSFTGGLLVFTKDDNTILSGYQQISTRERKDSNLGGCMSFESWVKHDKYLFFYDNTQKNIYYYSQNDYGQMVLGEPVAPEVQKFFNNISRLQMVSYIGENKSEIWLLSDKFKLIYDYFIGEWSERDCQELTSYFVYKNWVYSTGSDKCYKEKTGNIGVYDDTFIGSTYTTQIINLGSFSNMKEMEMQPLISVTQNYNNTFWVDCFIDGKKTKKRYIKMYFNGAVWADDEEENEEAAPDNELWDVQVFPDENNQAIQQLKGKFISNWYYLQFTFRTENQGDDFSITCFELKGITEEIDTIGRK